jgi:hypothetical protein
MAVAANSCMAGELVLEFKVTCTAVDFTGDEEL